MRLPLVIAVVLISLAAPSSALAADVFVQEPPKKLRVEAAMGETNKLTLTQAGDDVTVRDESAPLTAGAGCVQVSPSEVTCTVAPTYRATVDAEDGDDEVTLALVLRASAEGGDGDDVLRGSAGDDSLEGGAGADTIDGGDGVDHLSGGDDADTISGGAGDDALIGGLGPDRLDGGDGSDSYNGGDGDDTIAARDALRDSVVCGLGADSGEADVEDEVSADCEGVLEPLAPPTLADPGNGTGGDGVAAPEPVAGESVAIAAATGVARIKLAGTRRFVALTPGTPVPVGTTVDATKGTIALTSAADRAGATQTAQFTGGRFVVRQPTVRKRLVTELALAGGPRPRRACRPASRTTARASKAPRSMRRLWGRGKGSFRTRGRRAVATVRGTTWTVSDRCDGTLTSVKEGVVAVRDLVRRKTVIVRGGKRYLARKRAR